MHDFKSSKAPQRLQRPVPGPNRLLATRQTSRVRDILHAGNSGRIQAKLRINSPGDRYEQEADRVADRIIGMPEPQTGREHEPVRSDGTGQPVIQRMCAACAEEEQRLQTKSKDALRRTVTPSLESDIRAMRGGGHPLSAAARQFFEPRFGEDFSEVRIHNDFQAAGLARSINARAFTSGRDIAFAPGEYAPTTRSGQRLLAHELTHVLQQNDSPAGRMSPYRGDASTPLEKTRRIPPGIARIQPTGAVPLLQRSSIPVSTPSCAVSLQSPADPPAGWSALEDQARSVDDAYSYDGKSWNFRNKGAAQYRISYCPVDNGEPQQWESSVIGYLSGETGSRSLFEQLADIEINGRGIPVNEQAPEHNESMMIFYGNAMVNQLMLQMNGTNITEFRLDGYVFSFYLPCATCLRRAPRVPALPYGGYYHIRNKQPPVSSGIGNGFSNGPPVNTPARHVDADNPNCIPAKRLKTAAQEEALDAENGWIKFSVTPEECRSMDREEPSQNPQRGSGNPTAIVVPEPPAFARETWNSAERLEQMFIYLLNAPRENGAIIIREWTVDVLEQLTAYSEGIGHAVKQLFGIGGALTSDEIQQILFYLHQLDILILDFGQTGAGETVVEIFEHMQEVIEYIHTSAGWEPAEDLWRGKFYIGLGLVVVTLSAYLALAGAGALTVETAVISSGQMSLVPQTVGQAGLNATEAVATVAGAPVRAAALVSASQ